MRSSIIFGHHMGLSLTGSDRRGVGRKASILFCIIVIIILPPPQPNPEARELRDLFLLVQRGGFKHIERGRGDIAREVFKIVHAHVNPKPQKTGTQMLFDIFLESEEPKLL